MGAGMVGADLQALLDLAGQFTNAGSRLSQARAEVTDAVRRVEWGGEDAQGAVASWAAQARVIDGAVAVLTGAATEIRTHHGQQADASAATGDDNSSTVVGGYVPMTSTTASLVHGAQIAAEFATYAHAHSGSPIDIARAWAELSPVERSLVAALEPDLIRNLDGIPGSVKSPLNEAALNAEIDALQKADPASEELKNLILLRNEVFGPPGSSRAFNPPRQLLQFDTDSTGFRLVTVGIGNVDTAEHIIAYNAGLNTTTADLAKADGTGAIHDWARIQQLTQDEADGPVATVIAFNYRPPQGTGPGGLIAPEVLSPATAQGAHETLTDTWQGLDAYSRVHGQPLHLTVVVHSYGATTGFMALASPELANQGIVDDAILVSGPGDGGAEMSSVVSSLGKHPYVLNGKFDPVPLAGYVPSQLGEPFVNQVPAEYVLSTSGGADYQASYLHSQGWAPGTAGEHSIVSIGAGHPERAVRESTVSTFFRQHIPDTPDYLAPLDVGASNALDAANIIWDQGGQMIRDVID